MNNIVLIGFSQCGKTTVGKRLAEVTQQAFVELEAEMEAEYQKSISDLKKEMEPEQFREIEKNMIERLINRKNKIIAVRSETIEDAEIAAILPKVGTVIFLQTDKEEIRRRLELDQGEKAAAFDEKEFSEKAAKQESLFFKIAGIIISTAGKTPEAIVEEIVLLM